MSIGELKGYNGNKFLPKSGVRHNWTPDMVLEYKRCMDDPIYFAEKYIKIVHVDHGLIPIRLYDYQKEIITNTFECRNNIVCTSRQAGKCLHINTPIRLRNAKTGEIVEMTIGEFYEMQKANNSNDSKEEE